MPSLCKKRTFSCLLCSLVFGRSHACYPFEELREKGRVGKVQLVRYLEYQQIAVFQQYFRFKNNGLVDPLHYRLSACLTYNGAQIMRGQA